ncbi:MAG TPA: B12-binding domain-containing radical SAM protein [Pirellulales bacterium]|nr:B12-binding domain-containing radical SAM protein [Pirellulales bacterium]
MIRPVDIQAAPKQSVTSKPAGANDSPRVLLVYPRFTRPSFWNLGALCEFLDKRYPASPLGLITVAALLPEAWQLKLVDCNVEELKPEDIEWADLVLTTGMLPQQNSTIEVIRWARAIGKPVAVGGPDATSSPDVYAEADFRILGEAELVINDFIAAWQAGERKGLFVAEKFKADVSQTPIPRFDLLNFNNYIFIGVQYSRGCPFTCEFCDIIELYGRVPRFKTNAQMIAEIDRLYELGYRGHIDFVDDNFIGNKKAIKQFLPDLIEWQKQRGYPFEFSTEASINLADDDALMKLMQDANFFAVFIGIESPDTDTLNAMKKKQNTRRSLSESVHKIYAHGMFVLAGFILGFDSEEDNVADGMALCIEETAIPVCMIGLLYALPNTQLTRRLATEGRLYAGHDVIGEKRGGDQCSEGLNFETHRPRREILADFANVLERVYAPSAYFARVREVGRSLQRPYHGGPTSSTKDYLRLLQALWRISIMRPSLIPYVFASVHDCLRRYPGSIASVMALTAMYLHLGPFAYLLLRVVREQIAEIDRGDWIAPPTVPAASRDQVLTPAA